MNANFGLVEPLGYKVKGKKKDKNLAYADRAISEITMIKEELEKLWT